MQIDDSSLGEATPRALKPPLRGSDRIFTPTPGFAGAGAGAPSPAPPGAIGAGPFGTKLPTARTLERSRRSLSSDQRWPLPALYMGRCDRPSRRRDSPSRWSLRSRLRLPATRGSQNALFAFWGDTDARSARGVSKLPRTAQLVLRTALRKEGSPWLAQTWRSTPRLDTSLARMPPVRVEEFLLP